MLRGLFALTLLATAPLTLAAQWQLQDAHTTADLRGVDNVGGGVAWASGSNGTILRTEDAGFVWQLCAKPPGEHLDFRAIQAFDNNTAIIMSSGKGDLSRLYKTTDGCQTWTLLFTNPDKDGFLDALKFGSPMTGVLIGDPVGGKFPIFQSHDSGITWARLLKPALNAHHDEALFAASNGSIDLIAGLDSLAVVTGGAGGSRVLQVRTHDWLDTGGSLKVSTMRLPFRASESAGAFAVAYRKGPVADFDDMMIVGGDYKNESEGAALFVRGLHTGPFFSRELLKVPQTPPHGYRSAVAYDAPTKTWITVGPNGTDISTDDGRNWHALRPDPKFNEPPDADQHWNALSLPYVVGPHGRIATLRPSALQPAHP